MKCSFMSLIRLFSTFRNRLWVKKDASIKVKRNLPKQTRDTGEESVLILACFSTSRSGHRSIARALHFPKWIIGLEVEWFSEVVAVSFHSLVDISIDSGPL